MRYSIPIAGAPVQARSVHTVSPDRPDLMRDRNALLAATDDGLDQTKPFVVFGDFNTSPWAAAFRSLPGARAGDPRFEATFPAQALLLGLPIDHIMFGGGLSLREYHVGPDIGSDHLPLFATFSLPVR
jgi:endonuclease/exonuclease/phosphatase (EEP) superfamily protein YafD